MISANIEWDVTAPLFPDVRPQVSPFGPWFSVNLGIAGVCEPVIVFNGGWGKISAAASTQYIVDRWNPEFVVNLGTCGGFKGGVEKGTIVLVEKTIVYDVIEQMLDSEDAIKHYSTTIDLSWLKQPYPQNVSRETLLSADRDLVAEEIPILKDKYGAVVGDWESGAIAWVAARNKKRCLILRGVTDLVGEKGGEAYDGNVEVFLENSRKIMKDLVAHLPLWLARAI